MPRSQGSSCRWHGAHPAIVGCVRRVWAGLQTAGADAPGPAHCSAGTRCGARGGSRRVSLRPSSMARFAALRGRRARPGPGRAGPRWRCGAATVVWFEPAPSRWLGRDAARARVRGGSGLAAGAAVALPLHCADLPVAVAGPVAAAPALREVPGLGHPPPRASLRSGKRPHSPTCSGCVRLIRSTSLAQQWRWTAAGRSTFYVICGVEHWGRTAREASAQTSS